MNLDQFPHHLYEPTAEIQRSNYDDVYAITNATNHWFNRSCIWINHNLCKLMGDGGGSKEQKETF